MELAGITVDREALAKQVDAWDQELTTLKDEIAKLGITNPSSARQVATWLRRRAGTARRDQFNELGIKLAAHTQRQLIDEGETFAATHRRCAGRRPAGAVLAA